MFPAAFHPAVQAWFSRTLGPPTRAQSRAWPSILAGQTTLLLAPTGSGKTLAAFLGALNRMMFSPVPEKKRRLRVVYVSPLKALAVDIERNLQRPLQGIHAEAKRSGLDVHVPTMAIRTGDTPPAERARMLRSPPDILITTPESLFLMLTSRARDVFADVETVIVDEIHSLVASKRGAHLFLSLERLEALRTSRSPLQRIGLSATQRPLLEVARLLAGGRPTRKGWTVRPAVTVDAGHKKELQLRVEVPVEDMSQLATSDLPGVSERKSIWPAIHARLVELIRQHRSTMVFVNNRATAERLSRSLNELAGEPLALAHHGSVSKEKRKEVEERLKSGNLPAIVATSSLELGIDMGAVDLVVQVEAPPSVASGMQRVGRARHEVGGVPRGIIFPKHQGDLLPCAATVEGMLQGAVEETFYPRHPLDVLAQQLVAMAAMDEWETDKAYALVRAAAPFADLPRPLFDGVLDMLSGRYPSDEFAELRPRITWDRNRGSFKARPGAKRLAVTNAGTIPDRGLYGVFLDGPDEGKPRRVGELDEEMVLESRVGDVFLLGASSWRITDIGQDRVRVVPAPGVPGRMPFWHGDRVGRAAEFGVAMGRLARELAAAKADDALDRLERRHHLNRAAAHNLMRYLRDQVAATGEVPSDEAVVVERYLDDMGDWRICVMTPMGWRVHAPWATAVVAGLKERLGLQVELLWGDDGMVFRMPESEQPPPVEWFIPRADDVRDVVTRALGETTLFASRFRENAARALLLPRRHPGRRQPLWSQRKRSAQLMAAASRFGSFPIILETYRECLRDVFDVEALESFLREIQKQNVRVITRDSRQASPFAASLMFSYVANFLYDGDAPLAERRAQALSVDPLQLKTLLGETAFRELLSPEALTSVEARLQRMTYPVGDAEGLHDLLRVLGDLTREELVSRAAPREGVGAWLRELQHASLVFQTRIGGEDRWAAVEDAARLRDALGVRLPSGIPDAFLEPAPEPLLDLVSRYARTHGPFVPEQVATRLGLGVAVVKDALQELSRRGRVVSGAFLPGGTGVEWCAADVLRELKNASLARLRKEVEPVEQEKFAEFALDWHGIARPARGLDALLGVLERLQGLALPASTWEADILPSRIMDYSPADLDTLCSAGEVLWVGGGALGERDGRIAFYLADQAPHLLWPVLPVPGEWAARIRTLLQQRGAVFLTDVQREVGGFAPDVLRTLWDMVWAGEVTNDTLVPLRSRMRDEDVQRLRGFRSRRTVMPGSEGRWSLVPPPQGSETARLAAHARLLLQRHGVLTREAVLAESFPGGFSALYPVLKGMEEVGHARRGYFVSGLGTTQFAWPGAEERLRIRPPATPDKEAVTLLAAADPANPYGGVLPWPEGVAGRWQRVPGAHVFLLRGEAVAYARKADRTLLTHLPVDEPLRTRVMDALADALAGAVNEPGRRRVLLIERVDDAAAENSVLTSALKRSGFLSSAHGMVKKRLVEPPPGTS